MSKAPATFYCVECHQHLPRPAAGSVSTGYGVNAKGRKVCFECCGRQDAAAMAKGQPITLYLSFEKDSPAATHTYPVLTNWPGTLRILAQVAPRRHNMAGKAWSVWCNYAGRRWYGVQACNGGQIVTMRPLKAKANPLYN